mgnify:CR=1 FL=1
MPLKPKGGGGTGLPVIEEGNEGMVVAAKADRTGYELVTQSPGGGASSAEILTIAMIESY